MARPSAKDKFIIEFSNNYNYDLPDTPCCKRVVFVSLFGLFQTYERCPPHILYSALLVLPLQKKWIYSLSEYIDNIQTASSGLIINDGRGRKFIEMLQWKDSQSLLLFADDEYVALSPGATLHPFWQHVSRKLVSLYDPIKLNHYKPIPDPVDDQKHHNPQMSIEIMNELHSKLLIFKHMKAIFDISNPGSLNVITAYNLNKAMPFVKMQTVRGDFWITPDYFD